MMGIAKRGLGRRSSAMSLSKLYSKEESSFSGKNLSNTATPNIADRPLARRRLAAVIFREDL